MGAKALARVAMVAVVVQLAAAAALLTRSVEEPEVRLPVGVSAAVVAEVTATTTTVAPVVEGLTVETTPSSVTVAPVPATAPPTTTAPAAVYGVIGAGVGGRGAAHLKDGLGHEWTQEADPFGNYRIDGLAPGQYDLYLEAESAVAPCSGDPPVCIGSAAAISAVEPFELRAGEQRRQDFDSFGPTAPIQ
jgi:hypothetical protein